MHNYFLKKYYFIKESDPNHLTKLSKNIILIYRNYNSKTNDKIIIDIKQFCKKNRRKFYIANDIKLAIKHNLDGIYLPSFNRQIIPFSCFQRKDFRIIGSAHNIKEINQKKTQGISEIFISSVYKHNNNYLGLYNFNKLLKNSNSRVIALGGVNENNLKSLKNLNIYGIAGISFFQKKTAPKKGPLN